MTPGNPLAQITGFILEEQTELTLSELCRACAARTELIVALRLQKDLGVNLAGAALALELFDELDSLRTRLRLLEGR